MSGGLLVAGTTSDAGKSLLTAGICRWLYRRGVRVAPFKAQNMSNNSFVTLDGGEIGRAQAFQAAACGLEPSVRFNPVLLKPGSDRRSQVVVLGRAVGTVSAMSYRDRKAPLLEVVLDTLAGLRADHDVVICEGAGSPTEINLRATDIANMGLARAAGLGVVVVGDIDRGGVFASMFGTLALLSPEDQALVAGFVVNKFRGDPALLTPGLDMLTTLTGRPVLGTVPYVDGLWLDAEDSLSYAADGVVGRPAAPHGSEWLRVAVARLPRMSNVTDVEALAAEPGVRVRLVDGPSGLADADLVVLPGSKSTVDDLRWLRDTGLADAVHAHAASGRPVLGICGGYQMLGERIVDDVESGAGTVRGLGLLPVTVTFEEHKTLGRPAGTSAGGQPVTGYEIHHGRAEVYGGV
ncbi:MAG TPA: cobyric acid synthase, partial [Mycobacteriales bacterium]